MKNLWMVFLLVLGSLGACKAAPKEEMKKDEKGVVALTKSTFLEKVVNYEKNPDTWQFLGDKPCIVDFYASWCGPCKKLSPILDELAKEYAGKLNIYKVDVDKEPELASAFGVQSIPYILFCPQTGDPSVANQFLPKEELKKIIEEKLLGASKSE